VEYAHARNARPLVGAVGHTVNVGTGCDWLEEDGLFIVGGVNVGEVDGYAGREGLARGLVDARVFDGGGVEEDGTLGEGGEEDLGGEDVDNHRLFLCSIYSSLCLDQLLLASSWTGSFVRLWFVPLDRVKVYLNLQQCQTICMYAIQFLMVINSINENFVLHFMIDN
jgi:hypothetical protein